MYKWGKDRIALLATSYTKNNSWFICFQIITMTESYLINIISCIIN